MAEHLCVDREVGEQGAWIRLRGTADIATLTQLEQAFANLPLDGQQTVRIDVSGLDFVDVPALRCLATFATGARRSGRSVTTCGARPVLHRMARVLGLRDALGLS